MPTAPSLEREIEQWRAAYRSSPLMERSAGSHAGALILRRLPRDRPAHPGAVLLVPRRLHAGIKMEPANRLARLNDAISQQRPTSAYASSLR